MTTQEIVDEIVRYEHFDETRYECCARAELAAAALLSGGIGFRGFGRYSLSISVTRAAVSRYYYKLIKKFYGCEVELSTAKSRRFGRLTFTEITFPEDRVNEMLEKLQLKDDAALFGIRTAPSEEVLRLPCCQSAFLRSAFLTAGSMTSPEKAFEIAITCAGEEMAECVRDIMLKKGINAHVSTRRDKYVAYTKDAESVSRFLAIIKATGAVLKIEDLRIIRQAKLDAQRSSNCDSGNIRRTVDSARRQTEEIMRIKDEVGFDKLPAWAGEIAYLRLSNPDASLTEIGEMCDPPISKAAANKRFVMLKKIAEKYGVNE